MGYLILLFTIVPVVELALLIKVGQFIGVFNTLMLVILTGISGAYLARSQGLRTLLKIQEEINNGAMPADKIFDGVLILCAGILLITPGILTDIIGFLALIPFTRHSLKVWLKKKAEDMVSEGKVITITSFKHVE